MKSLSNTWRQKKQQHRFNNFVPKVQWRDQDGTPQANRFHPQTTRVLTLHTGSVIKSLTSKCNFRVNEHGGQREQELVVVVASWLATRYMVVVCFTEHVWTRVGPPFLTICYCCHGCGCCASVFSQVLSQLAVVSFCRVCACLFPLRSRIFDCKYLTFSIFKIQISGGLTIFRAN